jgi:hypothetical protein
MHATPILSSRRPPASDKSVQSLSNARGGFAAGAWRLRRPVPQLGGFAALYPNCGKQKNLLLVYDMHHNFAFFLFFYFASQRAQKCKDTALPRAAAAGWRMTMRKQYLLTTFGHPFGRNSRGEASLGRGCQAGAYDFLIRHYTHCLSPAVALTLLLISGRPVRWDGFNRSGLK